MTLNTMNFIQEQIRTIQASSFDRTRETVRTQKMYDALITYAVNHVGLNKQEIDKFINKHKDGICLVSCFNYDDRLDLLHIIKYMHENIISI